MKKVFRYLHFFFYVLGFASFILSVVYIKVDNSKISYNMLELIFGNSEQSFSIGLFIAFLMFLTTITLSISFNYKSSKIGYNLAVIFGLASGVLLFFARILSNPTVTDYNIHIGLILPGVLIIIGTIILVINKIIQNKN